MHFSVRYVLCTTTFHMSCVPTGLSPYVFHSFYVLHCNCTSLSSVVASEHYVYFVLPYASYRILCILVYLSYALRDEALYVRLLMDWLLSYGKCCHMFAIRK
jgi:hypothetical protein